MIGSHLLYELVLNGGDIKALKRKSSDLRKVLQVFSYYSPNPKKLFDKIEWVDGDVTDYFLMENLLKDVDQVFHSAGLVSFNKRNRKSMQLTNVDGTANMINAALENKVKKFCHVSSVAALGRHQNELLINEETNWTPSRKVSAYSESKFFSETEVWRGIEEGLDAVIINPSIVLGPGYWEVSSSRLFHTVWQGLKFYTKGVTGFVDVRDVVKAMILLMDNKWFEQVKNQRYLLSSENWSYQDLFYAIADALEKPRPSFYASNLMLSFAWRLAAISQKITGNLSSVSREAVEGSNRINNFDGSRISRLTGFQYRKLEDTIHYTAQKLKAEKSAGL